MKTLTITAVILSISISVFAQTKKPIAKPKPKVAVSTTPTVKASIAAGKVVYNTYCVSCHLADGGGVQNMNAPLIKTSYVLGSKAQLVSIILKGMQGVEIDGETYSNVMPSHSFLNNKQIADVLNYVRNNFGNKASVVTSAEVLAVRNKK